MITTVDEWIQFLKTVHLVGGFPLLISGLVLMLFGWRLWKVCVVLAFGVVGAVIAARIAGPSVDQWFYSLCGGVVLGTVSYFPVKHAVVALGGVLVMGVVYYYLSARHLDGWLLYAAMALGMFVGIAYSVLNRRRVVIFVTSFLGAVLLVSGMTTLLATFPGPFETLQSMASSSAMVIPFVLLVPTAMSAFYQIAEVHRLQIEV